MFIMVSKEIVCVFYGQEGNMYSDLLPLVYVFYGQEGNGVWCIGG